MAAQSENELIEVLYDAALSRDSWADVTSEMVGMLGGESLILSVLDPKSLSVEVVGHEGLTANTVKEYLRLAHHDPWLARAADRRLFNTAIIGTEILKEEELLNSFMYNEFLRPHANTHYLLGSAMTMHDGRVGIVGTHRPRDAKDFTVLEARRMARLLPHLRRALEVRSKLEHADQISSSALSVLDRLNLGVMMLSATGEVVYFNPAAEGMLRVEDGLMRTASGLRAGNHEDNKRLQALIARFLHGLSNDKSAGGHLRIRRPSGKQAYALMLAPAGSSLRRSSKTSPAILVFVSDPEEKIASDVGVLRQLFGFPQAEARLVLALVSGISLPDFARKTGVTYNTARTLLARAMARADARTQLDLVLRVASAVGGARASRNS